MAKLCAFSSFSEKFDLWDSKIVTYLNMLRLHGEETKVIHVSDNINILSSYEMSFFSGELDVLYIYIYVLYFYVLHILNMFKIRT